MTMSSDQRRAAVEKVRKHHRLMPVEEYVSGVLAGDRTTLAQAISLVESHHPDHVFVAREILAGCLPHAGNSLRIGITGVPGVGKSTFIDAFGPWLTERGHRLAVLAIDPSSPVSGGSILGDKTRMDRLSQDPHAFIRPSPSANSLGGVARKTRESILLCEAAGFDLILVETVGVGQSETAVHAMTDFFLLLMLAGAGDQLQGIKRGIMEMCDAMLITKADGENVKAAQRARAEYLGALHLFPQRADGWTPRVAVCSALEQQGMEEAWQIMDEYRRLMVANGMFAQKRQSQDLAWMHESMRDLLVSKYLLNAGTRERITRLEEDVRSGKITPFEAARQIVEE